MKDYWASIVSDDGQEILFANDYSQLPSSILNIARNGVNAVCWDKPGTGPCPTVRYFYPRPTGASPFRASLVPAYNAVPSPNRMHGPPLAFASCNPPVQSSGSLTVGSPDANGAAANSVGFARYAVMVGNAGTPADEADVSAHREHHRRPEQGRPGRLHGRGGGHLHGADHGPAERHGREPARRPFRTRRSASRYRAWRPARRRSAATCSISTSFDAVMPGVDPGDAAVDLADWARSR